MHVLYQQPDFLKYKTMKLLRLHKHIRPLCVKKHKTMNDRGWIAQTLINHVIIFIARALRAARLLQHDRPIFHNGSQTNVIQYALQLYGTVLAIYYTVNEFVSRPTAILLDFKIFGTKVFRFKTCPLNSSCLALRTG